MRTDLERIIGYKFSKIELARLAFTHASFSVNSTKRNNEKLEFFGDSLLNLLVTRYLVITQKDKSEGELSKIRAKVVSTHSLAEVVEQLDLERFMFLGKSELNSSQANRRRMHANLYEALVGAIYVDGNFDDANAFVMRTLKDRIDNESNAEILSDYKTALQELVQKRKKSKLIYELISRTGPDHSPTFCYNILLNDEVIGTACGNSKAEAQLKASEIAYNNMCR